MGVIWCAHLWYMSCWINPNLVLIMINHRLEIAVLIPGRVEPVRAAVVVHQAPMDALFQADNTVRSLDT